MSDNLPPSLGEQLQQKHSSLAKQLQNSNYNKIINKIKLKLSNLLQSELPVFELEIPLNELNISSDDVKDNKLPLYQHLNKWAESEDLLFEVHWKHPDCSYCENCGSGCKPESVYISWKLY
jgi:hypothetical protein